MSCLLADYAMVTHYVNYYVNKPPRDILAPDLYSGCMVTYRFSMYSHWVLYVLYDYPNLLCDIGSGIKIFMNFIFLYNSSFLSNNVSSRSNLICFILVKFIP